MSITGNLRTLELAELLQWLAQGTKTGVLMIENGELEKRIYFDSGKIIFSESNNPHEHLGSFLIREGLIDESTLTRAIKLQESTQVLLGKVLVTLGSISESELHDILRRKTEESIFELFSWEEGDFNFVPDESPDQAGIPLRLDVTNVVLEGLRRLDESRHTGQPLVEDHSGQYSLEIEEVINTELRRNSRASGEGDDKELSDLPVLGNQTDARRNAPAEGRSYYGAESGSKSSRARLIAAVAAALIVVVGGGSYLLFMRPDSADGAVGLEAPISEPSFDTGSPLSVDDFDSGVEETDFAPPDAVNAEDATTSGSPQDEEAMRSRYEAELASLRSELAAAKRVVAVEAKRKDEARRPVKSPDPEAEPPAQVAKEEVVEAPPAIASGAKTSSEVSREIPESAGGDEPPSLSGSLRTLSQFEPDNASDLAEELIEPEPHLFVDTSKDDAEVSTLPPEVPTPSSSVKVGEVVEPGPTVNPPVMLTRPKPTYPQSALRLKKEAAVTIRLLVDENGQVRQADRIGAKAGMGFDQAAITAAKLTRWQPATKEGVRVSMWAELTIQFRP